MRNGLKYAYVIFEWSLNIYEKGPFDTHIRVQMLTMKIDSDLISYPGPDLGISWVLIISKLLLPKCKPSRDTTLI